MTDLSFCSFFAYRDKIRDGYADMYKAFKKYDLEKTGYVSRYDLRKVLNEFSYLISDEQFDELMAR